MSLEGFLIWFFFFLSFPNNLETKVKISNIRNNLHQEYGRILYSDNNVFK